MDRRHRLPAGRSQATAATGPEAGARRHRRLRSRRQAPDDSATRALASGAIDAKQAATINRGAMQVERNWLNPDGIPGRPWFKHILYGARFTYAHLELPGLTEAVEKQDWPTAKQQAEILRQALVNNTKLVNELNSSLNGETPDAGSNSEQTTSDVRVLKARLPAAPLWPLVQGQVGCHRLGQLNAHFTDSVMSSEYAAVHANCSTLKSSRRRTRKPPAPPDYSTPERTIAGAAASDRTCCNAARCCGVL